MQSRTIETVDLLGVASSNSLTVVFPVAIIKHGIPGVLTGYAIAYVLETVCSGPLKQYSGPSCIPL